MSKIKPMYPKIWRDSGKMLFTKGSLSFMLTRYGFFQRADHIEFINWAIVGRNMNDIIWDKDKLEEYYQAHV